jgi:RNA polymerase sigma-70 factor (ECF subfamily)
MIQELADRATAAADGAPSGLVDEDALARRAQRGDRDALGQLYDHFYERVTRFTAGRLGDPARAEDVTSETFEAMLRGLGSYRPGTDFAAWLFTIAHRRVGDHFRRLYRRRETALEEAVERAGTTADPEEEAIDAADRAEMASAFQALRPDEQEVLALRVLAGLSAVQVGAVLGKSPGAVRVAQHRALRALRERMEVSL